LKKVEDRGVLADGHDRMALVARKKADIEALEGLSQATGNGVGYAYVVVFVMSVKPMRAWGASRVTKESTHTPTEQRPQRSDNTKA
jgi:hypothetical protein